LQTIARVKYNRLQNNCISMLTFVCKVVWC
jgi:hypothetical protein